MAFNAQLILAALDKHFAAVDARWDRFLAAQDQRWVKQVIPCELHYMAPIVTDEIRTGSGLTSTEPSVPAPTTTSSSSTAIPVVAAAAAPFVAPSEGAVVRCEELTSRVAPTAAGMAEILDIEHRPNSIFSADGIFRWPQTNIISISFWSSSAEITIPLTFIVGKTLKGHILPVVVPKWLFLSCWCEFYVAIVSGQTVGTSYRLFLVHQLPSIVAVQQLFFWDPGGDHYMLAGLNDLQLQQTALCAVKKSEWLVLFEFLSRLHWPSYDFLYITTLDTFTSTRATELWNGQHKQSGEVVQSSSIQSMVYILWDFWHPFFSDGQRVPVVLHKHMSLVHVPLQCLVQMVECELIQQHPDSSWCYNSGVLFGLFSISSHWTEVEQTSNLWKAPGLPFLLIVLPEEQVLVEYSHRTSRLPQRVCDTIFKLHFYHLVIEDP
ncbi:unnamed protein product [Urochloa humidicola]